MPTTKTASRQPDASSAEKASSSNEKTASNGEAPSSKLGAQLPDMSDAQLKALKVNAERISAAAKHAKKEEAELLLPLIEEQLAERATLKLAEQTERKKEMARKRAEARRQKAEKA